MSLNKKILAVAILGGLFAGSANAAIDISDGDNSDAVNVASEVDLGDDGVTFSNANNAFGMRTSIGYSFSEGEVRYARIECSDNMMFDGVGTPVSHDNGFTEFGAVNGDGTNAIYFSITAGPGSDAVDAEDRVWVYGDRTFTSQEDVTCTYSLYDEPSQAAAGGADGRIATSSGLYATFASSYVYDVTPNTETAGVESDPAFSMFVDGTTGWKDTATLAHVAFNTRAALGAGSQPIDTDGYPTTLAGILDSDTAHVITGDFSVADGDESLVYISDADSCESGGFTYATEVTDTTATFVTGAEDLYSGTLCYAAGNDEVAIPVSDYVGNLVAVSNDGYNAGDLGPVDAGSIIHDGTELQAPLAQRPNGWLSRMVLTNTGSQARDYAISVMGETGNAIGTDHLTGSVPAKGTTVVDLDTVLTSFTGKARATLNVTVAGPNDQIQGLYQIVNPDSGSISNHVMVRPGTN